MRTPLRWYLLGDGTPAEREAIALRVAADPEFQDELDLAVSQLIEAFVAGELTVAETEKFHAKFLVDEERRDRLAMARGLTAMGKEMRTQRWMAWAGGVVVLAFVGWLWMSQSVAVREAPVLALYLNSQRSVEMPPTLALSGASNPVVLELHCAEVPPDFIATLTRIGEMGPLMTMQLPKPSTSIVRLPISTESLTAGDYMVVLSKEQSFRADFIFRVLP